MKNGNYYIKYDPFEATKDMVLSEKYLFNKDKFEFEIVK